MAMIEAYRIGVELVLGGDLAAGIEALIPGLTRLEGGLEQTNAQAKLLATALGSVAATAPGIGQAAAAMERLGAAMIAMNQAASHGQAGGGAPVVGGAPLGGDRGRTAKAAPAVRSTGLASDAVAAPDPAPASRDAPDTPSRVGGGTGKRMAEPLPTVRALVQAVQPMPRMQTLSILDAPRAPGPAARDTEPVGLRAPALSRSVPAPLAVAAVAAVSKHSLRSPASVEQVLPALTRPLAGMAVEPPPRDVAAVDRTPLMAAPLREVVLPQPGGSGRVVQPVLDPPKPRPSVRSTLPTAPGDTLTAALAPVVAVQALMRDAGPVAASSAVGWPRLAASITTAQTGPMTQPLDSLPPPSASVLHAPLRDVPVATSRGPAPSERKRAWSDPAKPSSLPAARRAEPAASTAGLPSAPSYHPQGSQSGPTIQHVTYLQLDERTIARAVTRQQLRMMGGQVSGTLRPDPSIAPQYGAHLLEL